MLKPALLLFAVTVTILVILAVLPDRRTELPDQQIKLSDTRVTLYPEADPEAVWHFAAPRAEYDPETGISTLLDINDGRRVVGGETDFTVASERLSINRRDNIEGDLVFAYLVDTDECLTMRGTPGEPVLIDQQRGMFDVPVLEITGPTWGDDTRLEQMAVSFDLEEFDGGGPGTTMVTEFRAGAAEETIRSTVCENSSA